MLCRHKQLEEDKTNVEVKPDKNLSRLEDLRELEKLIGKVQAKVGEVSECWSTQGGLVRLECYWIGLTENAGHKN